MSAPWATASKASQRLVLAGEGGDEVLAQIGVSAPWSNARWIDDPLLGEELLVRGDRRRGTQAVTEIAATGDLGGAVADLQQLVDEHLIPVASVRDLDLAFVDLRSHGRSGW